MLTIDKVLRENVINWQRKAHLFLDVAFTRDAKLALAAIRQEYLRQGYSDALSLLEMLHSQLADRIIQAAATIERSLDMALPFTAPVLNETHHILTC